MNPVARDPHAPPYAPRDYAWTVDDQRRLLLSMRSFTTPAVVTLVLYFVLWFPGLIANIVWLREANEVARETGRAPQGKGLLVALFWVFGLLPIWLIGFAGVVPWIMHAPTTTFRDNALFTPRGVVIVASCLAGLNLLVWLVLRVVGSEEDDPPSDSSPPEPWDGPSPCRACGQANAVSQRYCGSCGAALR